MVNLCLPWFNSSKHVVSVVKHGSLVFNSSKRVVSVVKHGSLVFNSSKHVVSVVKAWLISVYHGLTLVNRLYL